MSRQLQLELRRDNGTRFGEAREPMRAFVPPGFTLCDPPRKCRHDDCGRLCDFLKDGLCLIHAPRKRTKHN